MFCAESSVVAFLSLLCFRLVILLFYVLIVYLYPCAAHCAYSINEWIMRLLLHGLVFAASSIRQGNITIRHAHLQYLFYFIEDVRTAEMK